MPRRKYDKKRHKPEGKYKPGALASLDGRCLAAKMMTSRYQAIAADLGGEETLSYLQRSLVEGYLWQELQHEEDNIKFVDGVEFDVGAYTQRLNNMMGLANRLGLKRVARDAKTLTVADYQKKGD